MCSELFLMKNKKEAWPVWSGIVGLFSDYPNEATLMAGIVGDQPKCVTTCISVLRTNIQEDKSYLL